MERLTNRNIEIPSQPSENADYWRRVHLKLAAYEDEEYQGLLLHLPCKVGDTLYYLGYQDGENALSVLTFKVDSFKTIVNYMELGAIGKTVFLTFEEAETKLAKEG